MTDLGDNMVQQRLGFGGRDVGEYRAPWVMLVAESWFCTVTVVSCGLGRGGQAGAGHSAVELVVDEHLDGHTTNHPRHFRTYEYTQICYCEPLTISMQISAY
ncbi:MAG: hypothetical protein NVS4B6_04570 [Mycobacterium sp.]